MSYKKLLILLTAILCTKIILPNEFNSTIAKTVSSMRIIVTLRPSDKILQHISHDELTDLMKKNMRADHEDTNAWVVRLRRVAQAEFAISSKIDADVTPNDEWDKLRKLAEVNSINTDEPKADWHKRLLALRDEQLKIEDVQKDPQVAQNAQLVSGENWKSKIKLVCKIGLPITALAIGAWLYSKKSKKPSAENSNSSTKS